MKRIGAYETKTNLSKILDRVAKGEQFAITRHGVPVAMIVRPSGTTTIKNTADAIEKLLEFRKRRKMSTKLIREMILEGRK